MLASPALQTAEVRRELLELAKEYDDPRRTQLFENESEVKIQDLAAAEEVVVTVSREGYVRQIPMAVYQRGARRGKGLSMDRYENDYIERAFVASTEDTLLFLSTDGRAFGLGVRDIPESSGRGKAIRQLFEGARNARLAAVHRVPEFRPDRFVLFATADGTVKRTSLDQYARARGGIEALTLKSGDRVVDARVTDGEHEVVLASAKGRAIRFAEGEVPVQGRVSQGVRGIKLKPGESVAGMAALRHETDVLVVSERGFAKRIPLAELPLQKRDGLGNALHTPDKETGSLAGLREVHPGEELMAITAVGRTLRLKSDETPQGTRATPMERALPLSAHDRVVDVTLLSEPEPKAEEEEEVPEEEPGLVERVAAKVLDLFS
jgi:DNA gyrase subunit A